MHGYLRMDTHAWIPGWLGSQKPATGRESWKPAPVKALRRTPRIAPWLLFLAIALFRELMNAQDSNLQQRSLDFRMLHNAKALIIFILVCSTWGDRSVGEKAWRRSRMGYVESF